MTKKKFAVIIISLILVIGFSLAGGYYFNKFKTERTSFQEDEYTPPSPEMIEAYASEFDIKAARAVDWSKDIQYLTKKYNLFRDVFNSDKPVFVYGYEKREEVPLDINTHKEIQKVIKENHFDKKYKIVAMTDFRKHFIKTLKAHNIPVDEDGNCGDETLEEREVMQILDEALPCYLNSCIVDSRTKKVIMISKFAKIIEKGLRDYK